MSDPFVGEIRIFGGSFLPDGWALCDGALIPIKNNPSLFALIGTTYGGDGINTFALPDLRGSHPIHQGNGYAMGQTGGREVVNLTVNELPAHAHTPVANGKPGISNNPSGNTWASAASIGGYSKDANIMAQMNPNVMDVTGGSQPHDNRMPYLAVNFIIALFGIFPPRE